MVRSYNEILCSYKKINKLFMHGYMTISKICLVDKLKNSVDCRVLFVKNISRRISEEQTLQGGGMGTEKEKETFLFSVCFLNFESSECYMF